MSSDSHHPIFSNARHLIVPSPTSSQSRFFPCETIREGKEAAKTHEIFTSRVGLDESLQFQPHCGPREALLDVLLFHAQGLSVVSVVLSPGNGNCGGLLSSSYGALIDTVHRLLCAWHERKTWVIVRDFEKGFRRVGRNSDVTRERPVSLSRVASALAS